MYLNNNRFPGSKPTDNVLNLLKLFLSKDPKSTIRAYASLASAICDDNQMTAKANKGELQCDDGFIWDQNKTCYSIPNRIANTSEKSNICQNLFGSKVIQFSSAKDVDRFMDIVRSGMKMKYVQSCLLLLY